MTRIFYVAPRENRRRGRGPFTLQTSQGAVALLASVIAVSVNDYLCGDDQTAEDARWYFTETYLHHASLLGLPDGMLPMAIADRVIEVEA